MSKRFLKVSLLGLLLVMCMSVAMAADVSEDTTSEVATPQSTDTNNVDTTDYVSTEDNDNEINKQVNPTRSYNPITVNTCINDSTWDNQSYDVYSNVKITTNITQSNNIAFNLNGNNITIDGLNIVNDGTQPVVIKVLAGSYDINILNTNITLTNTNYGETKAVVINNADDVLVNNTNINMSTFAQGLGWTQDSEGNWVSDLQTTAILVDNSTNVDVSYNTITMTNSTAPSAYETYSTTDAITVRKEASNVTVNDNIITMDGAYYLYAIDVTEFVTNALVENNNITLTGTNYICGVQLSSTINSIVRGNKIIGYCNATKCTTASGEAFAYGVAVLTGTYGASNSESTYNVIDSNNVTLTSTIAYAYELSNADYTQLINNNGTVTGNVVMGLGIYNSSYCNISGNRFIVSGNTRELCPYIYEAVYPVTTGIKINETSGYNNITNNYVRVTDDGDIDWIYSIMLYGTNNTRVEYNNLFAEDNGDGSVFGASSNDGDIVENNNL